jgi:hypothetical protein
MAISYERGKVGRLLSSQLAANSLLLTAGALAACSSRPFPRSYEPHAVRIQAVSNKLMAISYELLWTSAGDGNLPPGQEIA